MKKKFKFYIISILAICLLAGCGTKSKKPTESRVDGENYKFTGEEFKNYFNETIEDGTKIKEFKGKKLETKTKKSTGIVKSKQTKEDDVYFYIESLDKCMVSAKSNEENGKLSEVSIQFQGGTEENNGSYTKVKFSSSEIKKFKKYADAVFDVCEPNIETKKFEEFFDKCFSGNISPTTKEEIGDLKITLDSRTSLEMTFKPKAQK
ncbi:hypothetical protein SAMN02745163_01460 [Clostridium cavendishii DSM 21758]|uniref:Lipoprotein n=1 Tax=Clostridium cavendishii DSM 21758 TaxID=1121302 RepID=A0A1M6H269_9CLOT|nr:hypothetical protein [Clostridium cavendishii]SHJ16256.1 hypothetical protein SAMN02745163_01460 [Clostridium cavendishii DSM 21758]